jgi:hypothetical protein
MPGILPNNNGGTLVNWKRMLLCLNMIRKWKYIDNKNKNGSKSTPSRPTKKRGNIQSQNQRVKK